MEILTPKWVHEKVLSGLAPEAVPIPENSGFDWLYQNRDRINKLMLVPLKTDELRAQYNAMNKEELASDIIKVLNEAMGHKIFMAENKFPYALGPDVLQLLLWVADDVDDNTVEFYIKNYCSTNQYIVFERPRNADKKLVRGTFPQIRHIHVWLKSYNT